MGFSECMHFYLCKRTEQLGSSASTPDHSASGADPGVGKAGRMRGSVQMCVKVDIN